MQTKRYYCICCDGNEQIVNCPLCDDERFFIEFIDEEMDDYLVDFYNETILDVEWVKKKDEEKKIILDEELDVYRMNG
tara:strand:+ start:2907 stop:3140 length:234 start_codon:yes stop_codon:yes gene_type:complete